MSLVKRIIRASGSRLGVRITRTARGQDRQSEFERIYRKYQDKTMLDVVGYTANLALVNSVKAEGCVIECGVWKGGTHAGMAEVLGPDREYFLFDSFSGHIDPQPVDGPAAFDWQADKTGPYYFDNARVGPEEARAQMERSGAKTFHLVKGYFEDTVPSFSLPSPVAVLRVDCDWYASAMVCFRKFFPLVAEDGILIADGYPDWDGYARALHEYLAEYDGVARIRQWGNLYYVVKGARKW